MTGDRDGATLPNESLSPLDGGEIQGLLTQTILSSPVIKWILPARIRSKGNNDVVFVGEKSVQIKEAVQAGYLADVAQKTDFRGPILGAKVLNVTAELPLESQIRSDDPYDGPSQVLVLSVDMQELQFLYCSPLNRKEFVTFRRPFPQGVSVGLKFGKHIAVDPKSRAVAVSASRDYFGILRLISPEEAQKQMTEGKLDPIQEERYFGLDGSIMFMEFLYPRSAKDRNIVLLLIVQRDGVSYAVTYTWKDNKGLHASAPEIGEFKLRKQQKAPTMIIPLTKESSFLVVSPIGMAVYPSDGSTRPKKYQIPAPDSKINATALWTRWARPARNWLYSQAYDGIYVCREDGWVHLLEFGNEGTLESETSLGKIHCDVDTAFDVLDMGEGEGGDYILAGGSTGDAGLFVQEARAGPQCLQRFVNWAPAASADIVSPETRDVSLSGMTQNRLFTCSESAPFSGAIHEFRWGIEAQLGTTVPLDHFSSIRDMWTMFDPTNGNIYVLMSDPVSTLVLHTDLSIQGISALDEDQTGLHSGQSLAAGFTPDGILIQITETGTHLFVTRNTELNKSMPHSTEGDQMNILAVAVEGTCSAVLTAVRQGDKAYLYATRVAIENDQVGLNASEPIEITKEPICLSLQKFGDMSFIFLGNNDGTITVFLLENNKITYLFETSISLENETDISTVVESFATIRISPPNGSLRAFLLCGLRSGILVSFEIDFNSNNLIALQQKEAHRIGTTSIHLQDKSSFALFTCGNELWHVSYNPDCIPSNCFIRRVWIADRDLPAYFPTSLYGFGLVVAQPLEPGVPIGPLFCFADSELLICSLELDYRMVPRRIDLPGTPRRLTYSPLLQRLIVSFETPESDNPETPFAKSFRSHIQFVDPNSQIPVVQREPHDPWRPVSALGESITCILDWVFERNGQTYHMVALGTHMPAVHHRDPDQGNLILLSPRRNPADPSQVHCTTQFIKQMDAPVRALVSYRDSLIVGAGNRLIPIAAKDATQKWHRSALTQLPSAAISITTYENFIFVLTSRHSWTILEVISPSSNLSNEGSTLAIRSWDFVLRDGLTQHLTSLGDKPVLFMSHRGGHMSVSKFDQEHRTLEETNPRQAGLEANLPGSVLRFVPGGQRDGSYYGLTINGSVYRIVLPSPDQLDLLRVLQNLCYRDETICPGLNKRVRRTNLHDLSKQHVDGDILVRLSKLSPDFLGQLIASLRSESEANHMEVVLRDLAPKVAGGSSVEAIIAWLRQLLDVSF
ncbi:hypothetical protein N7456_003144 [Penicillium angulare]|uniref:DNA damage-binding protein 1 n=1 Tax=Penicillium angulare TaxID=116970 RepID=A0A9W9KH93_9EURO|nr:hypothetical protein N7456_003144 [Penicillium angulare]